MACLGERFSGSCGSSATTFGRDLIGRRDELGHRVLRVAQDHEERAQPRLAEVQGSLEDGRGQVSPAGSADGRAPHCEFAGDIEQPPASVAEAEHQRSLGEDLDLLRGGEDQANVPARAGGLGVADVGSRAGMKQRLASLRGFGPAGHVDEPDEVTLPIDQEKRTDAVAKPVKTLDGRQSGREAGGPFQILVSRCGLIVFGAEQKCPGRDSSVLVSREGRHSQRLEYGRDPVRADRIEIVGDDQVFGLILESVKAMSQLLIEESAEPKVDGLDDHLDHAPLCRKQRRRGCPAGT